MLCCILTKPGGNRFFHGHCSMLFLYNALISLFLQVYLPSYVLLYLQVPYHLSNYLLHIYMETLLRLFEKLHAFFLAYVYEDLALSKSEFAYRLS